MYINENSSVKGKETQMNLCILSDTVINININY